MNSQSLSLLWLRRDLRLHDHAALQKALESGGDIQPVFIFDTDILERFSSPHDRRLTFIARALCDLHTALQKRGGGLLVLHGRAEELIPKLAKTLGAAGVFAAEDYELGTCQRDEKVEKQTTLTLAKDHLIFAPEEILKDNGEPYKVFTPYSKAWLAALTPVSAAPYECNDKGRYADFAKTQQTVDGAGMKVLDASSVSTLLEPVGYKEAKDDLWNPGDARKRLALFAKEKMGHYHTARDEMGKEGTSRLSPYLRFGLVSVRECVRAVEGNGSGSRTWLKELIWREFYAMILYHFPESAEKEWNPTFRNLEWSDDKERFKAWQEGKTGFPLVDAAMRQLLAEGWMHNRARMVVASFLTKDLHIDWRWGEEHFAQHLMDYEMASNVGGWQWAASTGTDAQPWFRIFNPVLQSRKFDPSGAYIRRYVPELSKFDDKAIHNPSPIETDVAGYPLPIVDHAMARETALGMYKKASN